MHTDQQQCRPRARMASNSVNGAQHEPRLRAYAGATAATVLEDTGGVGGISWLIALGFVLLTFNSGMDLYRSNGDMGKIFFVGFSYLDLVPLFFCLHWFVLLTFNSSMAIASVAFQLDSLFFDLRRFVIRLKLKVCAHVEERSSSNMSFSLRERAPPAGPVTRSNLKMAVGLQLAVLTSLFSMKVAATMPAAVKLLVCLMAVATVYGGFNAFFLHSNRKVLATLLRSHLPETVGGGSSAHDPRDIAWSRTRLIVDSGATIHAVGNNLLLEGLVPYRPPLEATLADGSHVRILGIGRIQRGNFSIPNVSLVEGVQDGLISTPQLDARHGLVSCFGNGMCRIMEADGTEVGGAVLEEDGHYVLRFLEVPGTAQL